MSNVKKAFQPIVDVLEANKEATVGSILAQVIALCEAKVNRTQGNTALFDTKGKAVAVYDYFLQRWMPLVGTKAVDFGPKANTLTGVQGLSKIGLSATTQQNRIAKNAELALLTAVSKGEIQPSEIAAKQAEIETARKAVPTTYTEGTETKNVSDLGFSTEEEVRAYLVEAKVKIGDAPVKTAAAE